MTWRQRRVLVVDDEPDIVRVIKHMLNGAGYDVVPGYGAEDALRKVRRQPFDLVLTDLAMPGMSGVELIDEIRRDPETADLPIIGVTAYVWDGLGRSAGDLGCDGFVAKPFEPRALLDAVERYLPAHESAA